MAGLLLAYLPMSTMANSWFGESGSHGGSRSRKLSSVMMSVVDAIAIAGLDDRGRQKRVKMVTESCGLRLGGMA